MKHFRCFYQNIWSTKSWNEQKCVAFSLEPLFFTSKPGLSVLVVVWVVFLEKSWTLDRVRGQRLSTSPVFRAVFTRRDREEQPEEWWAALWSDLFSDLCLCFQKLLLFVYSFRGAETQSDSQGTSGEGAVPLCPSETPPSVPPPPVWVSPLGPRCSRGLRGPRGSLRFDVIQEEVFSGPGCPHPSTTGESRGGGGDVLQI